VNQIDWKRVEEIFAAAIALEPARREAYLESVLAGDMEVRHEVDALLAAHEEARAMDFSFHMATESGGLLLSGLRSEFIVGQKLGQFVVDEYLGEGGMGVVYRGTDTATGKTVAVKLLSGGELTAEQRKRLRREADAMRRIQHPNIVAIEGLFHERDLDFLVMEYVPGSSLASLLTRGMPTLTKSLDIGAQCAAALAAAHEAGVVHRDLTPANIMITPAGVARLLDFGLCRMTGGNSERDSSLSASGNLMGTVPYMAPEQAEGRTADHRADIFALGAVLYEMLTGRRVFDAPNRLAAVAQVLRDPPKMMGPTVPAAVERLVMRCLEKDPARRYQTAATVGAELRSLQARASQGNLPGQTMLRRKAKFAVWSLCATSIAIGAALWMQTSVRPGLKLRIRPSTLVRLTSDTGLTTTPTLSPDGTLLAYASDRSGEGNLDIWIQPVRGGNPVRLTFGNTDSQGPVFSPNGREIAFHSKRDGGGIYVIPVTGGVPVRLARGGDHVRFSPDGKWLAYSEGSTLGAGRSMFFLTPGSSRVFVMPAGGGTPRELCPGFAVSAFPIWAPDSNHILFLGNRDPLWGEPVGPLPPDLTLDWWVTSLHGGDAIPTGTARELRETGFISLSQVPQAWLPDAEGVLFSGIVADTRNLWVMPISRATWRVSGHPYRLTSGTTRETFPSIAAGNIVFASMSEAWDIWALPSEAGSVTPAGPLRRLTEDAALHSYPAVSSDGKLIAFSSNRSGNRDIWLKELSGERKEIQITKTPTPEMYPSFSPDGSKLIYRAIEARKANYYIQPLAGGLVRRVCEGCLEAAGWSNDGKRILCVRSAKARVGLLDLISGEHTDVTDSATYALWNPRFSPDERWISFNATSVGRSRIFVAPYRPKRMIAESQWTSITNEDWADYPRWSPNGNNLYYLSDRDGFRCIWAQQLDSISKSPMGEPTAVFHSHQSRSAICNVSVGNLELSIARDKVVFGMGDLTANIWMVQSEGSR
jgi:serine/threonine protein kinase/dipeptidyl aminopeptidase/acylaminoacyl peptidase